MHDYTPYIIAAYAFAIIIISGISIISWHQYRKSQKKLSPKNHA